MYEEGYANTAAACSDSEVSSLAPPTLTSCVMSVNLQTVFVSSAHLVQAGNFLKTKQDSYSQTVELDIVWINIVIQLAVLKKR